MDLRDKAEHSRPSAMVEGSDEPSASVEGRAVRQRGLSAEVVANPSYNEIRRRMAQGGVQDRTLLPAGYLLQEYVIEQVLGAGGFGVTYLARDTRQSQLVAIKEYFPADMAARDGTTGAIYPRSKRHEDEYGNGLTRFLLEARTLAGFRHPSVVSVQRFFEANNTAYMVMTYEQGESLNTWLSRRLLRGGGTPNELLLIAMFVPLLRGLAQAHEAGFLHRDIKPANIYVRSIDESLVLLDFGAAREAGKSETVEGLTSVITPGYAPIEQYRTHGRQGPWSDLYALGGVLYWFIAGRRPIDAVARLRNDPQQSAVQAGAGHYGEEFLAAIDWALTLDERARPQSVAEFIPVLTGDLPLSQHRAEPELRGKSRRRGTRRASRVHGGPVTRPLPPLEPPQTAKMDPQAAEVILDAEPALVMGREQSLVSPEGPAILAPAPAGPTTVTRAEQLTVIDKSAVVHQAVPTARPPRSGGMRRAWGAALAALLLAGSAGLAAWWSVNHAPLRLAVHPGAVVQGAAETAEWVASLGALGAELQSRTGRPVRPVALSGFADGAEGQAPEAHDLYLASLDQMGAAIGRMGLMPLVRFRDFRVNFLVRPEGGIERASQLRGKRIALYPGASSHGAIAMHWLSANGLRAQDVKLRVSRSPEAMIDALLFGQVDVVALPQYGADEALARYGAKLEVLGRSEPYPGFVLAAAPSLGREEAGRLRDTLLTLHDKPEGLAALKAVRLRQTTGTVQLQPVDATEVIEAAERLERARRLFPADAPLLDVR